jgi:hypothetical protein
VPAELEPHAATNSEQASAIAPNPGCHKNFGMSNLSQPHR